MLAFGGERLGEEPEGHLCPCPCPCCEGKIPEQGLRGGGCCRNLGVRAGGGGALAVRAGKLLGSMS